MNSEENLRRLLEEYPLYRKVEIDISQVDPVKIKGFGFNCFCKFCQKETTHNLGLTGNSFTSRKYENTSFPDTGVTDSHTYYSIDTYLTVCQYCKKQNGGISLLVESDKEVELYDVRVYAQKIGQYPPFNFKANSKTLSILSKSGQNLYKKARNLYVSSYGIGCMVYLRRIVEEEILSILKNVIEPIKIKELEQVEAQYQGLDKKKVYEYAGKLIPQTIRELGDNPIQKLWEISSIAIHTQTDEEAIEKCSDMIVLLDFLLERLDFEKSEAKRIKEILKD